MDQEFLGPKIDRGTLGRLGSRLVLDVCVDEANMGFKRLKQGELALFAPGSCTAAYEPRVGPLLGFFLGLKLIRHAREA